MDAISCDFMEKKDPIDTELGITSKNTEVFHVQGAVSAFLQLITQNNLHPLPKDKTEKLL